jgi:hypothetical protein
MMFAQRLPSCQAGRILGYWGFGYVQRTVMSEAGVACVRSESSERTEETKIEAKTT